jgi:hypothetical protein
MDNPKWKTIQRVVKEYTIYFNRIDPIKELASTFQAFTINQTRRQQVGSPPEQSLGGYTTVIPARII